MTPPPVGRGTIPSPNSWNSPGVYEVENRAFDPAGVIDDSLAELHPLVGARVLDVGCGTGFYLPRLAEYGARPVGLEPHLPSARAARERMRDTGVGVLAGSAEALPLPANSVDLVHARWAYFFGPGCEPGIAEAQRVLRPGGHLVVVDHDVSTDSTWSRWFASAHPAYDPAGIERFWARQGFETLRRRTAWTFARAADRDAVVGIEFPPTAAARFAQEATELTLDVAIALRWLEV